MVRLTFGRNPYDKFTLTSGESMHLVSFPHGSSIAKLARIHGLRKIVRIRLEVLDFARTHPVAVTCPR
jgi:hypothetical protein